MLLCFHSTVYHCRAAEQCHRVQNSRELFQLLEKQLPMTQAQVLKSSVAIAHSFHLSKSKKNNKSMWIRKLIQFFLQASGPLFIQVETFAACRSWSLRFGCCFWEFSTLAANCHQPSRGEPPTQCDPAACHAIEFKLSSSEAILLPATLPTFTITI